MVLTRYPRQAEDLLKWVSDPERAAEAAHAIVGLGTVVIGEDMVEATVTEEGTTEFSDLIRGFDPARGLRVETSQFLQRPVLLFA